MPDHAASQVISRFLAALRARLQQRERLQSGATWWAVVGGAALATVLVAAVTGPSNGWRPLVLLGAAAALGTGLWIMRRARQHFASDEAVARWLLGRAPHLGDELLSTVELTTPSGAGLHSAALVDALRARVADSLSQSDPRVLVDLGPARRRAFVRVGAMLSAWAVCVLLLPAVLRRGAAALSASRGEVAQTAQEPIVGDLLLELTYPAYTGLPPRTIPGSSGQVLAMPGTEVRITARALIPAREGKLVLEDEQHQPLGAPQPITVDKGRLQARFVVNKAGSWHMVLEGAGRRVREPEPHRIEIEANRPPRVDLYAPAEALEVAGPRRVELAYSLDDDYGLGDLALVWRIGDGAEQRKVVRPAQPGERAAAGKLEWDLAELDLKPGARVAYHLEAKDNDTQPGPNVGMSRTFTLSITSPREKHDAALADQERLLELALAVLANRLELKPSPDGDLLVPVGRVHAQAEALLALLGKVEAALGANPQTQDKTRKELREMHTRLGKLTQEEEQSLSELREKQRKAPLKPGQARALESGNNKHVAELERDVIALDDLLGRQRLEELLRVGDEMAQTRDRLKQLLQQYKQSRSEAVRKEIERELRELERKLAELRDKASRLQAELPDQFLNKEAMGKNDLKDRMSAIRDMLEKGNVDQALAELEKMSSSLDRMMASMEGDLRDYRSERFSAEEKALGELENQLSDLSHDEQQIKNDTAEVRQRVRAEAQRQMHDKVQPFARHAREQVALLRKQLEAVEKGAIPPYDQEELQRARQRVEDLDKMLQGGDLDEARSMAKQAHQGLEGVKGDLRDEEARAWRSPRPGTRKAREHVEEAARLARQLSETIDKALPRPEQLMSPEDQKRMGDLMERQKATRKRAQDMQREMGQKMGPDGKPLSLPAPVRDGLKDAAQHMERAEGELKGHDPRDAEGEESQALEKLSKMKQQLQEQRRPRDQMAGGRMDKEPVKIPGAEEYKAPKEFRQDLLEAMKKQAPAEYREQVKRYYEELVK